MFSTYKKSLSPLYHSKFWKQGYLVIPNYFSIKESENIKNWADRLEKIKEEKGKTMIYYERDNFRNKKISRIENFINYNRDIKDFIYNRITPTINEIYQKPMVLFKEKMNLKKAYGKGFKAHQDQPAWNDFPPSRYVSVALFANKTNKNNGVWNFPKVITLKVY